MHRFLFLRLLLSSIPREGEGAAAGGAAPAPSTGVADANAPVTPQTAPQPFAMSITDETARAFVTSKGLGDINALAKSALEANRYIDSTSADIRYPRDDAPDDVKADFYKRIGRPESADGYQFTYPEGTQADPKFEGFGKQLAHDLGLTPKQAQTMAEKWTGFAAEMTGAQTVDMQAKGEEAVAGLKQSWGKDFDANLAEGQKAFKALGLPADKVNAIEASIGTAPLMELMATLGKKMGGEAAFQPGAGAGGPKEPSTMTAAEATVAIDGLNADKAFQESYWDKHHPQHKASVERMMSLTAAANRR